MERIEKIQEWIVQHGLGGLLVDAPIDIYYLTQQELSLGRVLVTPKEALLLVDGRYYEGCKRSSPVPVRLASREEMESSVLLDPFFGPCKVGFDSLFTSYAAYQRMQGFQGEWVPLAAPLQQVRMRKEPQEIARLRRAAQLGVQGFDFVCTLLKEGVCERELACELEIFWKRAGGERLAFAPHIAFGANTAYPHHHVGNTPLQPGNAVLIDIGVVLDHYHSDMTRTFFWGTPTPLLEEIYEIVHEAQARALALCRPGTPLKELDNAARGWIAQKGYGAQFPHSLGHGVGLEIHEAPYIRSGAQGELEEGMVITIEPGIYLPEVGGVRLEDTVVITSTGYENLTCKKCTKHL